MVSVGDKATDTANISIHVKGNGKFWLELSERKKKKHIYIQVYGPLNSEAQVKSLPLGSVH